MNRNMSPASSSWSMAVSPASRVPDAPKRDDLLRGHPALAFCSSMIFRKTATHFSASCSIAPLRLRAQFGAVELFFHLVEGVVADLLETTHLQQCLSCRADSAAAQRIGRQLAVRDA